MALIKKTSIEEVVAAADMVDVVQGRTQLRKSGARWVGLCPFHSEKTPSFGINPVEKLFYCHGCHKGGDLITFVRETEGLDFAQAVEWLADRTGTQLDYEETSPAQEARRKRRDQLESLLEDAASFYSRYLWDTAAGESARAYLTERGLTEEVCRDFRLGLSPGGDRLAVKAREKGYSQDELLAAGLVNRRGNDYYAGRLVFPLSNARGRVLGFGARRLHDDDPIKAKYVNSPEGELFRKSRIVYGLHRARAAIAKQDEAVVVEGYTDVLALHQRGRHTVVASMGTALTEEQLKELGHLTKRLFLCFDADAAGEAATLRGMDLAAARGFQVRVVALPPGVDPADAADSFDERLQAAVGYLRHRAEAEIERGGSRQEQFTRVQTALAGLPDSPDREEAVRFAADRLGLSPDMQAGLAPRAQRKTGAVSDRALEGGDRLEKRLLAAVAADPELVEHYLAPLDDRHFDDPLHRRLRAHLCGEIDADDELLRARAELDATAETEHLDADSAKELFLRLEERMVRRELARLEGEDLARTVELQTLLTKIREAQQEASGTAR
ncbi:MAG TPA: DNA primase [Gaiellaceae bacterium]|jgi:DNA primase|nr:DNA primase [Gaiellaceae bacterium]